jgi:hypothetical protein
MDDGKKHLRDEVAELSEAVRELRKELAGRGHHGCWGHSCGHWGCGGYWQWQPTQGAAGVPVTWTVTNDTATAGVSAITIPGATTINAAAGGNTTYVLPANNTCAAPGLL